MPTIVQQLAAFAAGTRYEDLPAEVVGESKRLILDSIGCAFAAVDDLKGRIGIEFGRMLGGGDGDATVLGTGQRASVFGAAFANSELINALDFDAILPPGHVTPYVLPVALALGETGKSSGQALIAATAVSHEMSNRLGKAMDYLRDTVDGKSVPPAVFGYSSTIFGATAGAAMLRKASAETTANALGIAGCIVPVNAHWPWFQHVPGTTIKYLLGGHVAQSALTAYFMAELGHTGDLQILDDRDAGFARMIGTKRWEPAPITDGLGSHWGFWKEVSYKPYPHCRILHALFGAMTDVLDRNRIGPDEIDQIKVWVEGMVEQPVWLNRDIRSVHEAQFSIAHGIAFGAHRVPPSKAWQDKDLVFSPSVLRLMEKVTHVVHPDYVKLRSEHPGSQPARVEITARGQVFVGEQLYPKGTRSADPASLMTDDELIAKFKVNAAEVMSPGAADTLAHAIMHLEGVEDIGTVLRQAGKGVAAVEAASGHARAA